MAASIHSLARRGVLGVLARVRGSGRFALAGDAHALHERSLILARHGVEVLHEMVKVFVGAVGIVSTRV